RGRAIDVGVVAQDVDGDGRVFGRGGAVRDGHWCIVDRRDAHVDSGDGYTTLDVRHGDSEAVCTVVVGSGRVGVVTCGGVERQGAVAGARLHAVAEDIAINVARNDLPADWGVLSCARRMVRGDRGIIDRRNCDIHSSRR